MVKLSYKAILRNWIHILWWGTWKL